LAVNVAGAGPLVAIWLEWRAKRAGNSASWIAAARSLAILSLVAALVGVGLGLIALAILLPPPSDGSTGAFAAAIRQVTPDRWWFTAGEIAFYLLCVFGYIILLREPTRRVIPRRVLAVAAATNLLYHFPALFTILAVVPTRPELIGVPLDRAVFHKLLVDPEVISRVMHVWLASLAVTGVATSWIAWRQREIADEASASEEFRAQSALGGRIALVATMLQVPVGIWVLMTLPERAQSRLLGRDLLVTGAFALAILTSLALMYHLAMLALADFSRRRIALAGGLMCGVVFLMTTALQLARS
jgi:hypothetical protein